MQKNNTKKIHLYPVNNKFNNNIIDLKNSNQNFFDIASIDDSIYKYFYININNTSNLDNHYFIINSSMINKEIISFIANLSNQINITIFYDKILNQSEHKTLFKNSSIKHIINEFNLNNILDRDIEYKTIPNKCVNERLYQNKKDKHSKEEYIISFLEPHLAQEQVLKIESLLFPNTSLPIKLFDSPQVKNAQNLGYVTEDEKRMLLSSSRYYVTNNNQYYLYEALYENCIILNIDKDISLLEQIKTEKLCETVDPDKYFYIDFLKDLYL
jgi:hypothetical protein